MSAIRVELQLVDGSFVSGMLRSGQSLKSFTTELQRLDPHFKKLSANGTNVVTSFKRADEQAHSLLGTMRDVSIVMGAASLAFSALTGASGGVIGNIIKVNAEMERLRFQMQGMSSAADPIKDAAKQVDYLRTAATRAPFSIKELTSTFVKLKATGTDPLNGSMQALVDGIASFGGSDEQLHRVTLGITQMTGKSVVQMEEMRQQLGESMPTAMRLMARSMGVSISELIAAIGTGTLDAKSSLAAFYAELDRAYGGSAVRMMGTFAGQVTQMNANIQRLATTGDMAGFFENIKGKLQDFNNFLASPEAKAAVDEFGAGLSTIADAVAKTAGVLYSARSEVKMFVYAFAGIMSLKAISGALGSLGLSFVRVQGSIQAAAASVKLANVGFATASAGMSASSSVATLAGARFAQAGMMVAGVGSAISVALPWLGLLAAAAYFAADRFGLLGDNTDEAYESLVKYGAESRSVAKEALDAKKADLVAKIADAEFYYKWDLNGPDKKSKIDKRAAIDALQNELEAIQRSEAYYLKDAEQKEIDAENQKQDRLIKIRENGLNSEYDRAGEKIDDAYKAAIDAAQKEQKDTSAIREQYRKDTIENAKDTKSKMIALNKQEIDKLRADRADAANKNDIDETRRLDIWIENALSHARTLKKELFDLGDVNLGPQMIGKPIDNEALGKKGQNVLDSLREDVAGLTADINGASGEYAKMLTRIAQGDFGTVEAGGEVFKQLTAEILEATKQKEALDKILAGNKEADADLKRITEKARDDQTKLEERKTGTEANDADKALARLKNGLYTGLGPIEAIRASMVNLSAVTQSHGQISEQLGKVLRENTFGQRLIDQIGLVRIAMSGITDELNGMSDAAGMMNLGGIGSPNIKSNVDGGILDLIAKGESGGDYNKSLDSGRWSGGEKNLTGMTLNQVRELQKQMLNNPENRAMYGNGKGSSALGRYQIVGQTLQGLMKSMNLSGNELYDEKMQDAMAARLVAQRGNNPAGLRQEWTSLQNVSDANIRGAYSKSSTGPTVFNQNMRAVVGAPATSVVATGNATLPALPSMADSGFTQLEQTQITRTAELTAELERLSDIQKKTAEGNLELDRSDYLKKLKDDALDAEKPLSEMGKTYAKLLDDIRAGKLGKNKNIDAQEYKDLLAWAQKVDVLDKSRADRKGATTDADRQKAALEEKRLLLEKDIADTQARIKNPDYKAQSDDVAKLTISLDEYVASVKLAYGANSQAFKDAQTYRDAMVSSGMKLENSKIQADMSAQTRSLQDSLLSEKQLRAKQLERDLAALDERALAMQAAGASEVEITAMVEAQKAAIRARYNKEAMTPMQKQMEQWGNLSENMQNASVQWMDSAATGLAGLITGTGDLSGVVNGIMSDIANIGVRYMMSSILPEGKGGAAGAAGKMGQAGGKAAGGAGAAAGKMGVGAKHTGGIVGGGASGLARLVSGNTFSHAKKYHTGGIVGIGAGPNLQRGEIPIIAKKGEGVFTPEQMSAMGGFSSNQQFSISAPITVNGSAGTPPQNEDLAKKISREMDGTMRTIIQDELRKAQRPGNAMNNRS